MSCSASNAEFVAYVLTFREKLSAKFEALFDEQFLTELGRTQLLALKELMCDFLFKEKVQLKFIEESRNEIRLEETKLVFERSRLDNLRLELENRSLMLDRERSDLTQRSASHRVREEHFSERLSRCFEQERVLAENANISAKNEQRLNEWRTLLDSERISLQKQRMEFYAKKAETDEFHAKLKKDSDKEFEKRIAAERKERQREKNKHAAEKVAEALSKRNKEVEQELTKRVEIEVAKRLERIELERVNDHEASDAINVVVQQELLEKEKKARLDLETKARLFTGTDRKPRCPEMACTICGANESAVLYEPCMHIATCIDCVPRNYQLVAKKCQICRRKITDFKRVFFTAADPHEFNLFPDD